MKFGDTLMQLRKQQKLSQLELSTLSGISQRHISYLENGKSKPGPVALDKLANGLSLSYEKANHLYRSAGFEGPRPTLNIDDPEFKPAKLVIERLLSSHMPNPAVMTYRNGDIVLSNHAFDAILDWTFTGQKREFRKVFSPPNLYTLTLHHKGLRQFMVNETEIVAHTMRRLHTAAEMDNKASEILSQVNSFRDIRLASNKAERLPTSCSSVLIERYSVRSNPLNLVSMVTSFGYPEDVTAQALQIELIFPCDKGTQDTLEKYCSAPR